MSIEISKIFNQLKTNLKHSNEVPIGTECNQPACDAKIIIKVKRGTQDSLQSLRSLQEEIDAHNRLIHNK